MGFEETLVGRLSLGAAERGHRVGRSPFFQKRSVILTSATLSTQGNFDYIRERTGLPERRGVAGGLSIRLPAGCLTPHSRRYSYARRMGTPAGIGKGAGRSWYDLEGPHPCAFYLALGAEGCGTWHQGPTGGGGYPRARPGGRRVSQAKSSRVLVRTLKPLCWAPAASGKG